jgi:hypothetical protein
MHQSQYTKQINEFREVFGRLEGDQVLGEEMLTKYRSIVGQLNWISQHTRPDIAFEVSFLSMYNRKACGKQVLKLDKVVRGIKEMKLGIKMK